VNDQANRWLELSAEVPRQDVEAAEDALLAAGALSVTLADAADAPVLEPGPGETPLWPAVTVTGLFPGERDALELLALLSGSRPGPEWRVSGLADRAWEREWLRDFHPTCFGRRLWVVPSTATPPEDGLHIRLDPGLAFGTGTHPTTALCLEWLDALADASCGLGGRLVVDYGCGSGILAIAALRLGAAIAIAVDNDPQALIATRENALANEVSGRIVSCAPEALPGALAGRRADVLVANILAGPLVSLAPEFTRILAPGGRMALSGILSGQQGPVLAACRNGFHMDAPVEKAGWVRLQGTRKES
jgi:ribosomal protein L11 methyltransferase